MSDQNADRLDQVVKREIAAAGGIPFSAFYGACPLSSAVWLLFCPAQAESANREIFLPRPACIAASGA